MTEVNIELDKDNMLVIEIKNSQPVELGNFANSMLSIASEYSDYAEAASYAEQRKDVKLYINEIKKGSIIATLAPHVSPLLPLLSDFNTITGFAQTLFIAYNYLLGKTHDKPDFTKKSLKNYERIIAPVAEDVNSQMNIFVEDGGVVNANTYHISIDSIEANAIQNKINKEIGLLDTPIQMGDYENVSMIYKVTTDAIKSKSSDKVIIDKIIPKKALNVSYADEDIKRQILESQENIFNNIYLVDVEYQTAGGKPSIYIIKRVKEVFSKDE